LGAGSDVLGATCMLSYQNQNDERKKTSQKTRELVFTGLCKTDLLSLTTISCNFVFSIKQKD